MIQISQQYTYKLEEVANKCGFGSGTELFNFLHQYNIFIGGVPAYQFQETCFDIIDFAYFDVEQDNDTAGIAAIIVTDRGIKFIKGLKKLIEKNYVSR